MDSYIGMIKLTLSSEPPQYWQPCDGRSLAQADFPELFALIGARFGGDGQTFHLPNIQTGGNAVAMVKAQAGSGEDPNTKGMVAQVNYWLGDKTPDGWRECDGSLLPKNQFPTLANLLQNQFGGDALHFALPLMPPSNGVRHLICVVGEDPAAGNAGSSDDD